MVVRAPRSITSGSVCKSLEEKGKRGRGLVSEQKVD